MKACSLNITGIQDMLNLACTSRIDYFNLHILKHNRLKSILNKGKIRDKATGHPPKRHNNKRSDGL